MHAEPPAVLGNPSQPPHRTKRDMHKRLSRAQAMAQRELKLLASVQSSLLSTSITTDRVVRAVTKRLQASLNGGRGQREAERDGTRIIATRDDHKRSLEAAEESKELTDDPQPRVNEKVDEGTSSPLVPHHPPVAVPAMNDAQATMPAWAPEPPETGPIPVAPHRPIADEFIEPSSRSSPEHQIDEFWMPPPPAIMVDQSLQVDRSASSTSDKPQPPVPRVVIPRVRVESVRSPRPHNVPLHRATEAEKPAESRPPKGSWQHLREATAQTEQQISKERRFAPRAAYPPLRSDAYTAAPLRPHNKRAPFSVSPPPAESRPTLASRTGLRMNDRGAIDADHWRALADSDARLARLHARMVDEQMAAAIPRPRARPPPKKQVVPPLKHARKRQSIQDEWESFMRRNPPRPPAAVLAELLAARARQQPFQQSPALEPKLSRTASPKPGPASPPHSKAGESAGTVTNKAIPVPTPDFQRSEAALQNLLRIVEILEQANPSIPQPLPSQPHTAPLAPPPPPSPPPRPPPAPPVLRGPLLQLSPGLVTRLRAKRKALRAAQSKALGGWSDSPVDTEADDYRGDSPTGERTYAGPDPWVALDEITQALLDEATDTVGAEINALADEFIERLFDEEFLPAAQAAGG
ncbi:hypothetical protein HDU89_006361 [Geranomyces variabilis]|nr:hypothetical protein HDU89_006361 [Geranomyces variabilis]